jgi:hypothetical protein
MKKYLIAVLFLTSCVVSNNGLLNKQSLFTTDPGQHAIRCCQEMKKFTNNPDSVGGDHSTVLGGYWGYLKGRADWEQWGSREKLEFFIKLIGCYGSMNAYDVKYLRMLEITEGDIDDFTQAYNHLKIHGQAALEKEYSLHVSEQEYHDIFCVIESLSEGRLDEWGRPIKKRE